MANYFISVSGSDLNDGLSDSTEFQTFAHAETVLGVGDSLSLRRGDEWLENLAVPADSVHLVAHGSGANPVINGELARDNLLSFSGRTGCTCSNVDTKNATKTNTVTDTGINVYFESHSSGSDDQGFQVRLTADTTLIDCTAFDNDDDGASVHDTAIIRMIGGALYNNDSNGLNSLENTQCFLTGVSFYGNTDGPINGKYMELTDCDFVYEGNQEAYFHGKATNCTFHGHNMSVTSRRFWQTGTKASGDSPMIFEHCTFTGNGSGDLRVASGQVVTIVRCIVDNIRSIVDGSGTVNCVDSVLYDAAGLYGVNGFEFNVVTTDPLLDATTFTVAAGSSAIQPDFTIGAVPYVATGAAPTGYPAQGDVRSGIIFGLNDEYTGTLVLPALSEVLSTSSFGGTVELPEEDEVEVGVTFGPSNSLTGTYEPALSVDAIVDAIERDGGVLDSVADSLSGGGLVQVTLTYEDSSDNSVHGVYASVAGTSIAAVSNSDGQVVFNLSPNATYQVRVLPPPGFTVPDNLSLTLVETDITQTVDLTEVAMTVTFDDVYRIFGQVNVRQWADLDEEEVDADIDDRISTAIADATQELLDELRGHFDLDQVLESRTLRKMIARAAGLDLYERRGYEDDNTAMDTHRKVLLRQLERLLLRQLDPGVTKIGSSAPSVL